MGKKYWLLLVLVITLAVCPRQVEGADELYEGFREPPAGARPFVRWWWNWNCPTEEEILREIEVMKAAGIGGFEINILEGRGGQRELERVGGKPLVWLSPEWNRMIKTACDGARQRGMLADLIVGSGWPFGGRFLKSGEKAQIVTLTKKMLRGPGWFEANIRDLCPVSGEKGSASMELIDSKPRLMFLRFVPVGLKDFDPGIEMMDKVEPDGRIRFEIPAGWSALYAGVWREGFRTVTGGVPGAGGPALDYLNKAAVEKYLNHMSDKLGPALGGKLGDGLRAMFSDSVEISGSNWTTDFAEEFEKRRGYKLGPYLPFVLDTERGPAGNEVSLVTEELAEGSSRFSDMTRRGGRFDDVVRRARYDYYKTFAQLFHERFAHTYDQWCNRNGTLSRYQANGNPWHIDMLNGFMIPDIPEGDGWIVSGDPVLEPARTTEIYYRVWNKNASSAAHLAGRSIVSCESMTNTMGVFWTTLEYLKESDDLNFISGVTHSVLHGFNYSPPAAGFPGWVKFGTYFSEQNSWWPHFKKWADYNARLSYLFQNAKHQARVAILSPTADLWSDHGLSKLRFVDYIWYLHPMWYALNHNGYTTDYVSEKVVQNATSKNGKLNYGRQSYEVLIVPDARTVEPQSAKAIEKHARAGGKVIFVGCRPDRSPSLKNAQTNDEIVKTAIDGALNLESRRVGVVSGPEKGKLKEWARDTMKKFDVAPTVEISQPNKKLLQIHYRADDRDIFFFTSINRDQPISFQARFDTGDKTPWRWDPETGQRYVFRYKDAKNELDIRLEPSESLLLVFEPEESSHRRRAKPEVDFENFSEIEATWQVEFNHAVTGEQFKRSMSELIDLSKSQDQRLNTFAGTAVYRAEFDAVDTQRTILSLGKVYDISQVRLNGRDLGLRWWGRHIYDTSGALKPGKNVLEVKVTTVLSNYAGSLKDNPNAMTWAWWHPLRPAGLAGPLRLLKTK